MSIPLSVKIRPKSLDEFVGQSHFFYKGSLFYNSILRNNFSSAIFFGPSGTGKTTLAKIIANTMNANFYELNATVEATKEIKEIIKKCEDSLFNINSQSYLYVDEIHRWNKSQQDLLLKALENGTFRLIGSTTENPWFAINNAVISRIGKVYEFKPLSGEDILVLLKRALKILDTNIKTEEDALKALSEMSEGDARVALDTLGFILENIEEGQKLDLSVVSEAIQKPITFYDKKEDKYNLLSALQKSIRGTDPDAALHYLSRLIEGSGDVQMIGRRLMVIASEDIGLAYPQAISIVTSCVQAALMTGFPEARIQLANAVILLSICPKSNSVINGIDDAIADLNKGFDLTIPSHLMDSHYQGSEQRGVGMGYKYPHSYGGYIKQEYLPKEIQDRKYYNATKNGKEVYFLNFLNEIREKLENDN